MCYKRVTILDQLLCLLLNISYFCIKFRNVKKEVNLLLKL